MKHRIAVALSGGVDSLVTACLLKEAGHSVFGIHFITGYETDVLAGQDAPHSSSTSRNDIIKGLADTRMDAIGNQLGLPVHVVDLCAEFKGRVVDYFSRTYREGKTPNPCLVCNPGIKFGPLLKNAMGLGADYLATGHYAGIHKDPEGGLHLLKGVDRLKDQSYFLSFMTPGQLSRAIFPLGDITKSRVKKMASDRGLAPLSHSESQDICFIRGQSYTEFLGFSPQPGPIEAMDGSIIGEHKGLHLFTIGQRRGINCPGPEPYYVVRIDTLNNRLVVGVKQDLYKDRCRVEGINWIQPAPEIPTQVHVRLRYRHTAVAATLFPSGRQAAIEFETPQAAVTPGTRRRFLYGRRGPGRRLDSMTLKTFFITSLGCKVNQFESESIAQALESEGFSQVGNPSDDAAVCIINTCTVTGKAAMQSRQAIRRAIRNYPGAQIVVTGCYAQTEPEQIAAIQGVHRIVGHGDKHRICDWVTHETFPEKIICRNVYEEHSFAEMPAVPGSRTRAFLKIQDGCGAFCTYCIVPHSRGPSRSLPIARVLDAMRRLRDAGVKEVVLTGIHLGCYGADLDPGSSLLHLLEQLRKTAIIDRIRLSSIEPNEITPEIIELIRDWEGFCPHFHIPLQSGDDGVLSRMHRPYTRELFKNLVHTIRETLPHAAIGADLLMGFPGEDQRAFENTYRLIEQLPITYLHVFPYSPRPQTPAATFAHQVSESEKRDRCRLLRELGNEKKHRFYMSFVGKQLDVLVEGKQEGTRLKGTTSNYIPVMFEGQAHLKNRVVRVVIREVTHENQVYGIIQEDFAG